MAVDEPTDPSAPVSSSLRAKLKELEDRLAGGPSPVTVSPEPVAPVPEVAEAPTAALTLPPIESTPGQRQALGAGARAMVVATVLLLAAAAGMGAAAVVESAPKPQDGQAYLAGGLAAGLVLVLALIALAVRRRKSSRN
ncbi:MAG: hypothetical protein JWO12_1006 [Frankiales bacterium]|nr:hypothetical protein [Frankiales bacterium]